MCWIINLIFFRSGAMFFLFTFFDSQENCYVQKEETWLPLLVWNNKKDLSNSQTPTFFKSWSYLLHPIFLTLFFSGSTYPLAHFLALLRLAQFLRNFQKFPGNFPKFAIKIRDLLPLTHFRKENFSDSRKFLKNPITINEFETPILTYLC